ncbi:NepR family anti-sigma factor [Roseivivax isoporae]|uniref:Regulator n=1 Tax=Roseivivax isoporae LMG 25204 TaxID=1449351 RepID=X7F3G6_9RHOB|nr:NepR family anti-sigma factor [Roseivivax isoporae]ETX27293.1 regulator [Roseivivax isoporae LMG 25204]
MAQTRDNTKQAQVIDENLKRVYQDMLDQKVPDRFLDLLSQLKEQEQKPEQGGSSR